MRKGSAIALRQRQKGLRFDFRYEFFIHMGKPKRPFLKFLLLFQGSTGVESQMTEF